jgi:DASH complex subunit SPC19
MAIRQSQPHFKARESVFTTTLDRRETQLQEVCPPSLEECVAALEDCCEELHETQQLMRHGTHDYPRMKRILENERLFLLVPESTVQRYESDLADQVEPCITELLTRAEQGKQALEKIEASLSIKLSTAESRIKAPNANNPDSKKLQQLMKTRKQLEAELAALQAEVEELEAQP